MEQKTILVAGGDLRYVYTARAFRQSCHVCAIGFTRQFLQDPAITLAETAADALPLCDALVLPMPVSDDGVLVNAPFSRQSIPLESLLPRLQPDALVFGDGTNDMAMFGCEWESVAMGNAWEPLKERATYVTDHIDADGIWNACVRFGLRMPLI